MAEVAPPRQVLSSEPDLATPYVPGPPRAPEAMPDHQFKGVGSLLNELTPNGSSPNPPSPIIYEPRPKLNDLTPNGPSPNPPSPIIYEPRPKLNDLTPNGPSPNPPSPIIYEPRPKLNDLTPSGPSPNRPSPIIYEPRPKLNELTPRGPDTPAPIVHDLSIKPKLNDDLVLLPTLKLDRVVIFCEDSQNKNPALPKLKPKIIQHLLDPGDKPKDSGPVRPTGGPLNSNPPRHARTFGACEVEITDGGRKHSSVSDQKPNVEQVAGATHFGGSIVDNQHTHTREVGICKVEITNDGRKHSSVADLKPERAADELCWIPGHEGSVPYPEPKRDVPPMETHAGA